MGNAHWNDVDEQLFRGKRDGTELKTKKIS